MADIRHYAGIGSRETPLHIQEVMTMLSRYLHDRSYILRSGGANGADKAFEIGIPAGGNKEIYLPWKGFNGSDSPYFILHEEAFEVAKKFHPAWNKLADPVKALMARNVYQVLGFDLDTPVEFVVCWTKDGKDTGGTGQAIRIAKKYNIPVLNLYDEVALNKIKKRINYLQQKNYQHGNL